jgi:hypothetical protein
MALEEFENEPGGKDKRYQRMRSIMDYGMGALWIAMGVFLLSPSRFNAKFDQYDNPVMKIFAGVCMIYGLFRIYRGYKKNYFDER